MSATFGAVPLVDGPQDVPCPKCGGETGVQKWLAHECSVGCDTSRRYCIECDWQGEPE